MKYLITIFFLFFVCAATRAQVPVFNWEATTLNDNVVLRGMAIDGEEAVIVGYENGFFKSVNGGESWDTINIFPQKNNMIDLSIKGQTGYIVLNRQEMYNSTPTLYLNGYLMKTTDAGQTWEVLESIPGDTMGTPATNPGDTLCFGIDYQAVETVNDTMAFCALRWYEYLPGDPVIHSGIFETSNGGMNWKNISGDLGGDVITTLTVNGNLGFAAGNKLLFQMASDSDTLVNIYDSLDSDGTVYISDITITDAGKVYITSTADSIFYSDNGGADFQKLAEIRSAWDILPINDTTLVVAGNSNRSYISTDSGTSWTALGISSSVWEIAGVFNDSLYLLSTSEMFVISVPELLAGNFNFVSHPVESSRLQKAVITSDNKLLVAGFGGFLQQRSAGGSWSQIALPQNSAYSNLLAEFDFNRISMVGQKGYTSLNKYRFVDYSNREDIWFSGGLVFTDDNWKTWKSLDMGKIGAAYESDSTLNPNHPKCGAMNIETLKYTEAGQLLAFVRWYEYGAVKTEHSRLFKTSDDGKNWIAVSHDIGKKNIAVIETDGDTLYLAGQAVLLKTTEAQLELGAGIIGFTNLYPNLDWGEDDNMYITSLWADGDELFVTTTGDSCFMSTDGGQSFTVMSTVKGANDFYRFDNNSFMVQGGAGRSQFTNDGENWVDCQPGATIYSIGGEYKGKIYLLARGEIYSTGIEDLDLKTGLPLTHLKNELNVAYLPAGVQLSADREIERCETYSLNGSLISVLEPNRHLVHFQSSAFRPGMYIVRSTVKGELFTNKIVIR